MSEEEFRRCSPRKLFALIKQHAKFVNPEGKKNKKKSIKNGVEKNTYEGETTTLRKIQ